MSHSFARIVIKLGVAAALIVPLAGCAEIVVGPYPDSRCLAVSELSDGSWLVESPITFGRTIRVGSGATLHEGEVIDGVDLGGVLQRTCRYPSFNSPPVVAHF
jgi:hypothetical protein